VKKRGNLREKVGITLALLGILSLTGCQGWMEGQMAKAATVPLEQSTAVVTATPMPTPLPVPTFTPMPTPLPPTPMATPTPSVCPFLRGVTERGSFVSKTGETVHYRIHLPPCYDRYTDRRFPVLYLLHGWPMNESHWFDLGADVLADDWMSRGLVGPFILVMPGMGSDGLYVRSSGGTGSFESILVDELMPLLESEYPIWQDPAGRAIGGISRGGVWSLEIGLHHPELFGIVGGHSPALALNNPIAGYDPFFLAKSGAVGQRIYLDAGNRDWARGGAIQIRDVLIDAKADVTYQVHEGDHLDPLWSNALPDYLRFYTAKWPAQVELLPESEHAEANYRQTIP